MMRGDGCRERLAGRTDLVDLGEQHRVDAVREPERLPLVDRATHVRSMSSSAAGTMPAAVISATATPAARSEPNEPTIARSSRPPSGSSRRVTSVTMPSVPSDPTISAVRS